MSKTYFKHRGRFDFSPHRYEIGNPITQNKRLESNLFLVKLYKLHQDDYPAFYQFHLGHFLNEHTGDEETFFYHVKDITLNRIKHFKRLDPFSSKYASGLEHTHKLESFQQYLSSIDQWSKRGPLETMIDDKDALIERLNEQIKLLEAQLKEKNKYEVGEKIVIAKGEFAAFMDLVLQVQELILPNGHKFVRSQTQSPWYKLIAKYFQHGENEIPIDTARNYFPAQKQDKPAKFIAIAEKDKLFKIVLRDQN